eukprot:gnl/TRDRNA2_/TRDRNA2_84786_c0_seq1.p1 gnl/TRDRNA2_/TRDRNA2_84786_c0~~gnl/TRDRNA2_/TRDRNA2_84786_c0_seq1.p1  ORF type:complete len:466 (-),score=130.19 gnl/TRDRNA2_/TRDRNA2_84786_c0_seq1:262-1584(-)
MASSAVDAEEPDFAADDDDEAEGDVGSMAVDAGSEAPAADVASDAGTPPRETPPSPAKPAPAPAPAPAPVPAPAAPAPAPAAGAAGTAAAADPVAEGEREEEVMPWEGDGEGWLEMLRDGFFRQMREENDYLEPPPYHRALHFAHNPGEGPCPSGKYPAQALNMQLNLLLKARTMEGMSPGKGQGMLVPPPMHMGGMGMGMGGMGMGGMMGGMGGMPPQMMGQGGMMGGMPMMGGMMGGGMMGGPRPGMPSPGMGMQGGMYGPRPGMMGPGMMGGMNRPMMGNPQMMQMMGGKGMMPGMMGPMGGKGGMPQQGGMTGPGGAQGGMAMGPMGGKGGMPPQMQQGMRPMGMQQQPPQQQQGAGGMSAASLAAAPPGVQKQMLGEKLYPAIAKLQPALAGKITGMMLEMDNSELLLLLESEQQLKVKVDEALRVLESIGQGHK